MTKKKERRRSNRVPISLPTKYKVIGKKGTRWTHTVCKDIGGLGFRLFVNEPLKMDEQLRISVLRKDNNKTMFFNCRVVWCIKDSPKLFVAGVEISKVENPLAFIEFVGDMLLDLRNSSITVYRKRRKEDA